MTTPRVLIIAAGDPNDGDHGLAPALLAELRALPLAESWWLTLVTDAEFHLDHVIELQRSDLALFVDCERGAPSPFVFREIDVQESEHSIALNDSVDPSDVLHTLATIGRRDALPPAFELTLQAESFSGREGLSAGATSNLSAAVAFVEQLLAAPEVENWRRESTG